MPVSIHLKFANCALVLAASFLDDRDGLPNLALGLQIPKEDHRVSEVAGVEGRLHDDPSDAVLGDDQEGHDALMSRDRSVAREVGSRQTVPQASR